MNFVFVFPFPPFPCFVATQFFCLVEGKITCLTAYSLPASLGVIFFITIHFLWFFESPIARCFFVGIFLLILYFIFNYFFFLIFSFVECCCWCLWQCAARRRSKRIKNKINKQSSRLCERNQKNWCWMSIRLTGTSDSQVLPYRIEGCQSKFDYEFRVVFKFRRWTKNSNSLKEKR